MPLLSTNTEWETFGERALLYAGSGGADFGECIATVNAVGDDGSADDWYREWTATADRVAAIADDCAAKGHVVSAREAYLRASTYYRASYFPLFGKPVDDRLVAALDRDTETFGRAAGLADFPLESMEIAYEGGSLPAYFARPDDSTKARPTIVQTNGYDANVHEMFFANALGALRRGYNWLGFDGPGQGRPLIRDGLPMRPDWENVVRPVIDHVLELDTVDADKIVLVGWSFGGYLAPRAAAFEHRPAALVADPGLWDQRDMVVSALPLSDDEKKRFPDIDRSALDPMEKWLREKADPILRWKLLDRGLWVNGADTLFDYFVSMLDYELSSCASEISCPTLVTMGKEDRTAAGAPHLFDSLTVREKQLVEFTVAEGAGGHCEMTARSLYNQRVFDWLDEIV